MADQAEQVSTTGLVDTRRQPGPTKRREYSEALKRRMVAETLEPGASVSIVARRHDVNSNQLFRWVAPASSQRLMVALVNLIRIVRLAGNLTTPALESQ